MEIVKIISEWKKRPKTSKGKNSPVGKGKKRVEAIIKIDGCVLTRHIDIKI